jgi:PadR family transcriptional regulator PadR
MIFSSELIKGTLKTIVLKLLKDKKMYGYEITQRVKELTINKIQISEARYILHFMLWKVRNC